MKSWRPITRPRLTRLRRALAATAVAALAFGTTAALTAAPASATPTAGQLANVSFTVSNNAVSAPGVTYTWGFTTGSGTQTLSKITLAVPSDTPTATLALVNVYGLVANNCTGGATPVLDTGTDLVTVTLTGCDSATAAGTPVAVVISGFSNTTSATTGVTGFESQVTTFYDASGTATQLDQGTVAGSADYPAARFSSNTTGVTVIVPESLTFTNGGPTSILLLPIPGTPATNDSVDLTVATNAAKGYTLSACVGSTGIQAADSAASTKPTIPQLAIPGTPTAPTATSLSATDSQFGASPGNLTGSGALATDWADGKYSGYPATDSCADGVNGAEILSNGGPTSGDSVTMTNGASVSNIQQGGTYTGTITYVVNPTY